MMKPGERILGVEGGGTKTAWVLVEPVAGIGDPGWEFHVIDQGKLPAIEFSTHDARASARDFCGAAKAN